MSFRLVPPIRITPLRFRSSRGRAAPLRAARILIIFRVRYVRPGLVLDSDSCRWSEARMLSFTALTRYAIIICTPNRPISSEIKANVRQLPKGHRSWGPYTRFAESTRVRALRDSASRRPSRMSTANCRSCLLYTSPSPRDRTRSRMPSSA